MFKKKIIDIIKLGVGGTVVFCGVSLYNNNEKFEKSILMPAFHLLDPETAHRLSIIAAKYKLLHVANVEDNEILRSKVWGLDFCNPIGIAAGFDKNGEAVDSLFKMGFGFVEVGTVTPEPQLGNPKPRVFRLPAIKGIINRYGFNNDGHEVVYDRLSKLNCPGKRKGILGVNLGKNKCSSDPVNDYVLGVKKFGPLADYLVINVSSPNTPGLRLMQRKQELEALISAVLHARSCIEGPCHPAILLKISPDLSIEDKKDIAQVITSKKCKLDGLIISNTTISRPSEDCLHINESGGLSGEPLKQLANDTIRDMAVLTKGLIPIIGVGGISNGEDALESIQNGASLVQVYSALAYQGLSLVPRMKRELQSSLKKNGFTSIEDAVGSSLKK